MNTVCNDCRSGPWTGWLSHGISSPPPPLKNGPPRTAPMSSCSFPHPVLTEGGPVPRAPGSLSAEGRQGSLP